MDKPVLVVMAAGMGSRYGGLKQMDPMDDAGHVILDFSVYDAMLAGFEKVIFIIKKENEAEFRECVGDRIAKRMQVEYAYQELDALPEGYQAPEGRVKPFGTGHAVLSCKDKVNGPFAVINADDFYGRHAYQVIYDYLSKPKTGETYQYVMVGYIMENTLTENGHVARGVCQIDDAGHLVDIHERTRIEKKGDEFFLPSAVQQLMEEDKAVVTVLKSEDRWYGVTYKEDKETVMKAIADFKEQGVYPKYLWES